MTEKPFNILQKCNVTGDYFTKLATVFDFEIVEILWDPAPL